jgi:hypothetical protein
MAQRSCGFGGHAEVARTGNLDGAFDEVDERPEVVAPARPVADGATRLRRSGVRFGHCTKVSRRNDGMTRFGGNQHGLIADQLHQPDPSGRS